MWSKISPTHQKLMIWVEASDQTPLKDYHNTRLELEDMRSHANSMQTLRIEEPSKLKKAIQSIISFRNRRYVNDNYLNLNRFGTFAARGGVDLMLTRNDDGTIERMLEKRKGSIGPPCDRESKK